MKCHAILLHAILLGVLLVLSACVSTHTPDTKSIPNEAEDQEIEVTGTPVDETAWLYQEEVTRKGTRSEGVIGHLYYKGRELEGFFTSIAIGKSKYDFVKRTHMWDFGGYKLDKTFSPPKTSGNQTVSEEELTRGWYYAPLSGRKQETPEDWVWVQRGDLRVFIDPEQLGRFIEKHELEPMDPYKAEIKPSNEQE
jgi:hypothetical protein